MYSTAQVVAKEVKLPQLPPAYLRESLPSYSHPSKSSSSSKPERRLRRNDTQAPPSAREEGMRDSFQPLQRRRANATSDGEVDTSTNVWPSEQYRLWIGASNLPVEPLVERSKWGVSEPRQHPQLPTVECTSVQERRPTPTRRRKDGEANGWSSQQPPAQFQNHAPQLDMSSRPGTASKALRLPSRMGRHSLERYEKMHCYTVNRVVLKLLNQQRRPALHSQLLEVRSTVRHPERRRLPPAGTRSKRKGEFQPCRRTNNAVGDGMRKGSYSDVSPPPSPLCLQHSCIVTSYSMHK